MAQTVTMRITESSLPTRHGRFRIVGYRTEDGTEHVALCHGVTDGQPPAGPTLVRLHSECLTGDAFGSYRCDCGEQLDAALARIAAEGGVVIYLRGHEGRGIGLVEKLRAYHLQDNGADTVEANLMLGHPADLRDYRAAAEILRDLGISSVALLSSNPAKSDALAELGIDVETRLGMFVPERPENAFYFQTKRQRMRHDIPRDDAWSQLLAGRAPSTRNGEDVEISDRYGELATDPSWVIAQSAQSLDGFIATTSGDGAGLSGQADLVHLHRLRALADAVVVGATTVINDAPRLTVRLPAGENPVRVVLDPSGRVPADAGLFTDGLAPTVRVVGPNVAPLSSAGEKPSGELPLGGVRDLVLPAPFEPTAIIEALWGLGLRRVLVEGGGTTVSRFLAAGVLDRLFVTSVPVFLGGGVPGVRPPAASEVTDGLRPVFRRFLLGEDICTEFRWS